MGHRILSVAGAAILVVAAAADGSRAAGSAAGPGEPSPCGGQAPGFELEPTIVFSSTRADPATVPAAQATEIYLVSPDGSDVRRLTDNSFGDGFANLSPDGRKIVFDSDRLSGQVNVSDLFLMDADGSQQAFLVRGSSATWSPDCRNIAYHASASGAGTPIRGDPGSATTDSDIFVANVDDLALGHAGGRNLTNSPGIVEDDPDWSPDGQYIVYTAHPVTDHPVLSNQAEIFVARADGSTASQRWTDNTEEERAPAWSPDGTRVAYNCRVGAGSSDFEICVMTRDGSPVQVLTSNAVPDLTPTFSPDGHQIVFHRLVPGQGLQLFTMNAALNADGTRPTPTQLSAPPGINLIAHWGVLRVKG